MAGRRDIGLLVLALALPACALTAGNSLPAGSAENAPTVLHTGTVAPGPGGVVALAAMEEAVRDDALRAWPGLKRAQLQLHSEVVTWADGSLGCAQPGRMYTQALIPGWRLVVRSAGREAVYHASQGGYWLLCARATVSPAQPGGLTR